MKRTYYMRMIIALCATAVFGLAANAQSKDTSKNKSIAALINSHNYAFKAQNALPMTGRMMQLTSDYDLQIYSDHLVAALPYYGRAYNAPINPTDGGLEFSSKDPEYTVRAVKKNRWEISIRTKDQQDEKRMQMTVFDNGTASLQVTSNNLQSISFNGFIAPLPAKK